MTIRFATINDRDKVLQLLDQLGEAENEVRGYSTNNMQAHVFGKQLFAHVVTREDAKIFLAEENRQILGVVTFYKIPYIRFGRYRGYIMDFVVNKSCRSKGIGAKLLKAVKEYCRVNNISSLRLDTGLPRAQIFYEANGGISKTKMYSFETSN